MRKISLIAMYEYFDGNLFDRMQLPPEYDKETAVQTILLRGGMFPVVWSNPDFVRNMIRIWSNKNYLKFKRWAEEIEAEFNPLYNYDRYEDWTDKEKVKDAGTAHSETDATTKVSAYDTNTMQPESQALGESDGSSENNRDRDAEHKGHLYGNIGVTTATAMLTEAWTFYEEHNIYDALAEEFCKEFCLMIY